MKLLHITTDPRTLGFLLPQIDYMRSRGYDVVTAASPGEYESVLEKHSIPFFPVAMERRITPFRDIAAISRIYQTILHLQPQIVHAHTPKAGLLGMIAATLARIPLKIFHVHGLPHLSAKGSRHRILLWSTRLSCLLADRVFCVSVSMRNVLAEQRLCPEHKTFMPLNGSCSGIDAKDKFNRAKLAPGVGKSLRERHGIPVDAFVIAFVGRLVRDKGLIELGEAWTALRSVRPDMHLFVVGEFESQDALPDETVRLFQIDPGIHLTGFCADMPALYAASDLVVLPSYREGLGIVSLEAAAMELPVITTAVPGCVDAVEDEVTGTLIPPRDSPALARSIARYIDDEALRRKHGAAGRTRVLRDFDPATLMISIYDEYKHLLSGRGIQPPDPSAGNTQTASGREIV